MPLKADLFCCISIIYRKDNWTRTFSGCKKSHGDLEFQRLLDTLIDSFTQL